MKRVSEDEIQRRLYLVYVGMDEEMEKWGEIARKHGVKYKTLIDILLEYDEWAKGRAEEVKE